METVLAHFDVLISVLLAGYFCSLAWQGVRLWQALRIASALMAALGLMALAGLTPGESFFATQVAGGPASPIGWLCLSAGTVLYVLLQMPDRAEADS